MASARPFTGALLPALLAVHLLAAHAFGRHAPTGSGSAPAVEVLYTTPTNDGPSPATGHGNQPSAGMALDGELNGDPGTTAVPGAHATFSPSPRHRATDESPREVSQLNTTGVGEGSGARP